MVERRERPILFSGAMVRALLDGRKSQTRRIDKQPTGPATFHHFDPLGQAVFTDGTVWCARYGVAGDYLWVKETWAAAVEYDAYAPSDIPAEGRGRIWYLADGPKPGWAGKTRVSIHMPRWASRLLLEETEIRVMRLQAISEADIVAEGATVDCVAAALNMPWSSLPTLHHAWQALWDSINGQRPGCAWAEDPWVWAVSFRVVEGCE